MVGRMRERIERRRVEACWHVYDLLKANGPMSSSEISRALKIRMLRVFRALDELIELGTVQVTWARASRGPSRRFYMVAKEQ